MCHAKLTPGRLLGFPPVIPCSAPRPPPPDTRKPPCHKRAASKLLGHTQKKKKSMGQVRYRRARGWLRSVRAGIRTKCCQVVFRALRARWWSRQARVVESQSITCFWPLGESSLSASTACENVRGPMQGAFGVRQRRGWCWGQCLEYAMPCKAVVDVELGLEHAS